MNAANLKISTKNHQVSQFRIHFSIILISFICLIFCEIHTRMDPTHLWLLLLFLFIINCHQIVAQKFIKIYAQNGTIRPILEEAARKQQSERAFAESLFFGQPMDFPLANLERAKRDTSAAAKTT